ncbi:hypothetical protein Tco_0573070 [Tanacetum coccineum]
MNYLGCIVSLQRYKINVISQFNFNKILKYLGISKTDPLRYLSLGEHDFPLVKIKIVIKEWEDRMERAATTASSLEAEQDSVTLVDETQEMNDDNLMFDTDVAEKEVSAANPVTTAGEVVTTANVEVTTSNAPTTTIDELTLAQTLIEIKAAKPKVVTSAATTTTTTRPKARGVVVQEPSEFKTTSSPLQASQLPQAKDKGKAKCSFVPMDSKEVKSSKTRTEECSKRAGDELESNKSKKQKIDEHVEVEKDDQEEAEMKRHI